jgi:uncharacterized protein (DUF302 family)
MVIIMESNKSLAEVCDAIAPAAQKHKFGVLGVHNLKETMAKKGVAFDNECRIYEVCNPVQARKVLEARMAVSTALPCRISVYEEGGRVKLATMKPTGLMAVFNAPELEAVALEVEQTIIAIMRDAAAGGQ